MDSGKRLQGSGDSALIQISFYLCFTCSDYSSGSGSESVSESIIFNQLSVDNDYNNDNDNEYITGHFSLLIQSTVLTERKQGCFRPHFGSPHGAEARMLPTTFRQSSRSGSKDASDHISAKFQIRTQVSFHRIFRPPLSLVFCRHGLPMSCPMILNTEHYFLCAIL